MKRAVAYLTPFIEAEKVQGAASSAGKILMATVKGDVHDIGKNIVSVVLGCNNYDVIDLGVMVPASKILDEAIKQEVDIIGLSGLITPSLDEMIHVAAEMERRGMNLPLLIGGATTSKIHTAVKIAPAYTKAPVVYVLDASRSVPVVESLLGAKKDDFVAKLETDYNIMRERHANSRDIKEYISIEDARKNKLELDFSVIKTPDFLGVKTIVLEDLEVLKNYIDWTPFFQTWELAGRYPDILVDEIVGEEATRLFEDAEKMLNQLVSEKWFIAKGVLGIFEAQSTPEDDILVYDSNANIIQKFSMLRQQNKKAEGQANYCLSDFIAPVDSGKKDFIGAFAVATGFGIEAHLEKFAASHDDYSSIMLKALADRLAEAFAEYLHAELRKHYWGYANDENLSNEELIKEKYKGIRPAPGYPACPDHTEKLKIWELLKVEENAGIKLTESLAMLPVSAVSGWYFAHPDSRYFGLGKIKEDQLANYAIRKGMDLEEMKRWLSPILA